MPLTSCLEVCLGRGVWIRWTGTVEWNGGMDWTGLDWNGMERPEKLGSCGCVLPLPLKFGDSRPLRRDYGLLSLFAKSKDLCLQTHLVMISGTDLALSSGPKFLLAFQFCTLSDKVKWLGVGWPGDEARPV